MVADPDTCAKALMYYMCRHGPHQQAEKSKMEFHAFAASVTEACFEKCIGTPGKSLGSGETDCLEKCAARYLEATQFLNQRLSSMK